MAQTNESQEQVTINVETLQPVTRTLMTIGALPTSYLISMTYEEQLLWLQNYLIKTVIPAINNNAEATQEVQDIVMALQDYINDYFNNLDVQEEINNKLDEMAESGELTDIIAQYLGLAGMITFNDLDEMIAAENLVNGSKCQILGYNELNDGGASIFKITNTIESDKYQIPLNNNLYATLISCDYIRVKDFGAIGDGITDDTNAIQKAINIASVYNKPIVFERYKTYIVNSTLNRIAINGGSTIEYTYGALILKGENVIIIGNNAIIKNTVTQTQYNNNDLTLGAVFLTTGCIHNASEIGESNNYNGIKIGQNIIINNLTIDGGSENINQTAKNWARGTNNCKNARGISTIGQPNITITLNNTNIINCLAEGMSGGGIDTSVFVNGGEFKNVFPSPLNISGKIEIIDGAIIDNPMALEFNPSYKNGTQILRNCTINSTYESTNMTYVIGAVGLLDDNPVNNSNVIIENNIINISYLANENIRQSLLVFHNINNLTLNNNKINFYCSNYSPLAGYGSYISFGNINNKQITNNKITADFPTIGNTNNFSYPIYYFRPNTTINHSIYYNNVFELKNEINISGTNLYSMPNVKNVKTEFNYIYHLNVTNGATTIAYRIAYMDYINKIILYSPNGQIEFTNFDIQGFGTSSFESLIGGIKETMIIPKQGKIFNLNQFDPNANGESIWIKSNAVNSDLKLDIKLICE